MNPTEQIQRRLALILAVALALQGCGGGGGGPTAPALPQLAGASIGGQVVGSSGTGSSSSVGRAGLSGATTISVKVSVRDTGLSTVTDAEGRFHLASVPTGNRVLVFEEAGQKADLPIAGVRSGEAIDMVVSLSGSSVQVLSMNRGSNAASPQASSSISLEKTTNGEDADIPPGPEIAVGDPVSWEYEVTNEGGAALTGVRVSDDDPGVVVSCPATTLAVGRSMTCTASGTARAGQYANLGTATGRGPGGETVTDDDPSHYFGAGTGASITLEKSTNGEDADFPPGPTIPVGDPVSWEYEVTNDGQVALSGVTVSDDVLGAVSCPQTTLAVGESMTCTASGTAQAEQYANLGTATGEGPAGETVSADDRSHYFGGIAEVELTLEIQPDAWNTNWVNSSGTVSALIRGSGLEAIDLASILLYEDDPANALAPSSEPTLTGEHVRARFPQAEAFEMLSDPEPGQTRTVTVGLLAAGTPLVLTDEIKILGPGP